MKLIIAGGRKFNNRKLLVDGVIGILNKHKLHKQELTIISGVASGADKLGLSMAKANSIGFEEFPADWKNLDVKNCIVKHGKYGEYNALAGHNRNCQMAYAADELLAFWDGESTGTKHMISFMESLGKPVTVVRY